MNYYEISVDGKVYQVSIERAGPEPTLCAKQAPVAGEEVFFNGMEIIEIHRQATWVTAPRVAHLPAR